MTLFADREAILEEVRRDRLFVVGATYFPDWTPHDDYIYSKVLAAEKEVERRLRVYLQPVTLLPEGGTEEERNTIEAAGEKWMEEPGYDLQPHFFAGDTWGFIPLRQRPVAAVESVKFVYPAPANGIFTVPPDWIRLDKKYGHLRMVPTTEAALAPLNMYVMQALTGGRSFPQMIHVRYRAGLENAINEHPDVVDVIKKIAVIKLIDDLYLPQSGSESIDGMSQSLSNDASKFTEKVDATLDALRESIHGIRMGVL